MLDSRLKSLEDREKNALRDKIYAHWRNFTNLNQKRPYNRRRYGSSKTNRKIIETIYYSVQTKSFDEFVTSLESKAVSVGGYIEQSDVRGNSYDDISSRYATYTFRIPSEKVDEFTKTVSNNATITNRTVNTEDVTLQYVDIESRIKALKTEKASLEELL